MTRRSRVLATTHVDQHGHAFTKQALEGAARQLSERPTRLLVEHDVTIPPIGKVVSGQVVSLPDGADALVVEEEPLSIVSETTLPDGTEVFELASIEDRRSISRLYDFKGEGLVVSVDPTGVSDRQAFGSWLEDLSSVQEFDHEWSVRKSFLPEPEIIIQIGNFLLDHPHEVLLTYLLSKTGKHAADNAAKKIGDEIGDDIYRLYRFLRTAPATFLQRVVRGSRPLTCVYVVPGNPEVSFVVRSQTAQVFDDAVNLPRMRELVDEAQDLGAQLQATEVHYLYDLSAGWKFNYLITASGGVIGTKEALDRQHQRIELLMSEGGIEENVDEGNR